MESKEFIMEKINIIHQQFIENDQKQDAEYAEFKKKIKSINKQIKKSHSKKFKRKFLREIKKNVIDDFLHLQNLGRQWEKKNQIGLQYLYDQYNYMNSGH